jgi:hypothetical protein
MNRTMHWPSTFYLLLPTTTPTNDDDETCTSTADPPCTNVHLIALHIILIHYTFITYTRRELDGGLFLLYVGCAAAQDGYDG